MVVYSLHVGEYLVKHGGGESLHIRGVIFGLLSATSSGYVASFGLHHDDGRIGAVLQ